jgi:hypothetical protein
MTCIRQPTQRNSRADAASTWAAKPPGGRTPRLPGYWLCIRARHGVRHGVEPNRQVQISAPCLPLDIAKLPAGKPPPGQPATWLVSAAELGHGAAIASSISDTRSIHTDLGSRRRFRPSDGARRINADSASQRQQVHRESQRRQYDLVEDARRRGFREVEAIDDDLGRSASGTVARPGFERLVASLCAGDQGLAPSPRAMWSRRRPCDRS